MNLEISEIKSIIGEMQINNYLLSRELEKALKENKELAAQNAALREKLDLYTASTIKEDIVELASIRESRGH